MDLDEESKDENAQLDEPEDGDDNEADAEPDESIPDSSAAAQPERIAPTNPNSGNPAVTTNHLAIDVQSIEIIGTQAFDPYDDHNIKRREKKTTVQGPVPEPVRSRSFTAAHNATEVTQDVRNNRPDVEGSGNINNGSMSELITIMAPLLEKMSASQNIDKQSRTASLNAWNNPRDTERKARKAFSSQFAKKPFSGRFGSNLDRHQERFIRICAEWEIDESEYVDYLQETLSGDPLNYVKGKVEDNPNITWTNLSKLLKERYTNVSRQKEVSDRLYWIR